MTSLPNLNETVALLITFLLGLICGILVGYIWADHKDATFKSTKGRKMTKIVRPSMVVVLLIFAGLQILTGGFMIVQYGRLTNFIDCQASYNESTSDARDAQIPARDASNDSLFDVIVAVESGDQNRINAEIDAAIRAHNHYVEVKRNNPYKPPSDFCDSSTDSNNEPG